MTRTTRSNKVFSPWDFERVPVAHTEFDLEGLLRAQIQKENANPDASLEVEAFEPEFGDDRVEEGYLGSQVSGDDNDDDDDEDTHDRVPLHPSCDVLEQPTASSRMDPSPMTPHLPPRPSNPRKRLRSEGPDTQGRKQRKKKRNAASHAARAKRREDPAFEKMQPRKSVQERYTGKGLKVFSVPCPIALPKKNATQNAFVGRQDTEGETGTHTLEHFVREGYKVILWDGFTPKALVDRDNRVIGILAGHPDAEDWPDVCRRAAEAMEESRHCRGSCTGHAGRRGPFSALQCGVSHGGGQVAPRNLYNDPNDVELLNRLNGMSCFQRVSSFSNSVLLTRAPKLFGFYAEKMGALFKHNTRLKRPFPKSIFCACTYNLGPCTVCYKHRDSGNLSFGMCAVTPFGDYDPTLGGHLVLWDCRLVIEFPPGSTIMIPSALIAHSNTGIQPGEHCYSFTQYSSGSLFRWVENGFKKSTTHLQSLSKEDKKKSQEADKNRWEFGLSLLEVLSD